jgi:hypothetical protein
MSISGRLLRWVRIRWDRINKPKKCLVMDCPNCSDAGAFIGDLCAPCHEAITTRPLRTIFMMKRDEVAHCINGLERATAALGVIKRLTRV